MAGNHDRAYKQLFAHPEMVRDLLAGFTPFACFQNIDASAFERVNASYITDHFTERHNDMVWRVRVGLEWVYVYLLLEFQSRSDRWMALRMQVYVGLLYQDLVKRRDLIHAESLPAVFPLVFYNGDAAWGANTSLTGLLSAAPPGLESYQPQQSYLVIDQRALDPAELGRRQNLVAAIFRLELSDSPLVLAEVLATLSVWLDAAPQAPLRRTVEHWLLRRLQGNSEDPLVSQAVALWREDGMGERFFRKYASFADMYLDQGLQQGLLQGREEGREEGRLSAMRAVLQRMLGKRFGTLDEATTARIVTASEAEVGAWIERLMDARTLADIFSAPPG